MGKVHEELANNNKRNRLIAQEVIKDALDGHVVLVMTYRTDALDNIYWMLVDLIERRTKEDRDFPLHSKQIEWMYDSFLKEAREDVRLRLEQPNQSKILITTHHLFSEVSEFPSLSALHWTFPAVNELGIGNICRLRRILTGKRKPQRIVYYTDKGLDAFPSIRRAWVKRVENLGIPVKY